MSAGTETKDRKTEMSSDERESKDRKTEMSERECIRESARARARATERERRFKTLYTEADLVKVDLSDVMGQQIKQVSSTIRFCDQVQQGSEGGLERQQLYLTHWPGLPMTFCIYVSRISWRFSMCACACGVRACVRACVSTAVEDIHTSANET